MQRTEHEYKGNTSEPCHNPYREPCASESILYRTQRARHPNGLLGANLSKFVLGSISISHYCFTAADSGKKYILCNNVDVGSGGVGVEGKG